ncbi:MAG: O-antigen/teichoic acid export membrane protein [Cognaticolwellia sp.]|jgi:O-antigen/teichoic acid export membrane protein
MPMTPGKALGVPAVVGLVCTILSYGLAFALLSYLGQMLFPDAPGDQPIYVAAIASLLFASLGGTLGARFAFGRMKKQFEREQAALEQAASEQP